MDINKKIQEISDKVIEEKLPEIIEKQVTETLEKTVGDVLGNWSDFKKKLETEVASKLDVSLENLKLIDYSTFITNIVEQEIGRTQDVAVKTIRDRIKEISGVSNVKEIRVSELVEKLTEQCAAEDYGEMNGEISFHCYYNERHNWHSIYIDPESDKEPKNCSIEILLSSKGDRKGKPFLFKVNDNWSYHLAEVTPASLSRLNRFELYLFRLVNSNVTFVIDPEDVNKEWYKYEDY